MVTHRRRLAESSVGVEVETAHTRSLRSKSVEGHSCHRYVIAIFLSCRTNNALTATLVSLHFLS
jgi:hypothetical protein